jgi:uncharacterized protein YggU (UPF0235/DUF167 family)
LNVRVIPGAARAELVGRYADGIKLRVTAAPEGGRANAEVLTLLAGLLRLPAAAVSLARGQTSQNKVVAVNGLTLDEIFARLVPGAGASG